HLAKPMITIRSSKEASQVALMCLEATLTTPRNVYSISSEGAMTDSRSSFDGNLFGRISWPVSRFRVADGLLLEQQMFLPRDESTVAMSWALHGETATAAQLVSRHTMPGELCCFPACSRGHGQRVPAPRVGDLADNNNLFQLACATDPHLLVGGHEVGR